MAVACTALPLPISAAAGPAYRAQFRIEIRSGEPGIATGRIRIVQANGSLRRLTFDMPPSAFSVPSGDGRISRTGGELTWEVPARGGEIRYRVALDHRRGGGGYDALLTDKWGIFRAEDVFPAARAAHAPGAKGESELFLDLPPGWSGLTPYLPDAKGRLAVTRPGRSYARPLGWLLVGQIGARKDEIGDMTVRVAAPLGEPAPRVPMLALLRWTLPVLQEELGGGPPYLLIVLAGDPMWRGGLSAPNSLFEHAARPLISENGTSTLVHEIVHVMAPVPTMPEHDWIDEGLAEYVGLVVLQRSNTISRERFDHAVETFRRRGTAVRTLKSRAAAGEIRARAVAIFHDVDEELQARSRGATDIFDLVRLMMAAQEPLDAKRLRDLAARLAGGKALRALAPARVPDAG